MSKINIDDASPARTVKDKNSKTVLHPKEYYKNKKSAQKAAKNRTFYKRQAPTQKALFRLILKMTFLSSSLQSG